MKTCLGLLSTMCCCCAVMADEAVDVLSKHVGRTPALVVVVCRGDEGDLPTIAALVGKPLGQFSVGAPRRLGWTGFAFGQGRKDSSERAFMSWMATGRRSGWRETWPMRCG